MEPQFLDYQLFSYPYCFSFSVFCKHVAKQPMAKRGRGAGEKTKVIGKSVNVRAVAKWLHWHQRILIGCFNRDGHKVCPVKLQGCSEEAPPPLQTGSISRRIVK